MRIQRFETLWLTLVVGFAMMAISAPGAAASYTITTPNGASLTSFHLKKHKFTIAGQSIECNATFSGTLSSKEASEVVLTPTYSSCTFAGKTVDFTANGCDYRFTGATNGSHGLVHYECPAGKSFELHVTGFGGTSECTLTITPSANLGGGYAVFNDLKDIEIDTTVTGLKIDAHGSALFCGIFKTSSGTYSGTTTLQAFAEGQAHIAANEVELEFH